VLFALIFIQAASAQTISIVQGNGQLDCEACATGTYPFLDDEVVLVKDANGNPASNVTVTWTVIAADGFNSPQGTLDNATTVTSSGNAGAGLCNQAGYSCNRYSGNDTGGQFLRVMAVTASLSNGQSVTFTLTETPNAVASGSTEQNANVQVTGPTVNTLFEGTAGSTSSSTPITVTVVTNGGQGIPNVSVRLVPDKDTPAGSPTASCATKAGADPGSTLTDSTGTATCNVVFGPIPSTGQAPNYNLTYLRLLIGGVVAPQQVQNVQNAPSLGLGGPNGFAAPPIGRFELIVTPATPNAVQIITGNFQSANRGQAFAAPLVVKVVDASSPPNALPSVPLTWSVVPAGAAIVTPASTTTDSNGQVSATVALTNAAAGLVQVTATTANGKSVTFSLSVNVQLTGLTISSGNNQSVSVGQLFQPITVQAVVGSGQSNTGIPVQFTVTSGPATVAQSTATTNTNGLAAVSVQAGSTPGPVIITATSGTATVTFNLTVLPPGLSLTSANFLNGAGFFATGDKNSGALSPCSIGTVVVGAPLTSATLPAVPNLFGAAIQQPSSAIVTFNSESAPILGAFGNSTQTLITFQVPCDVTPGTVPVSVTLNNASTLQPVQLAIRSASPGIFELPMSDGVRRAVAVRPDGTFVSLANPARRSEIIRIYVTGIGPTSPPLTTNALPTPGVDSLSTATYLAVQIGNPGGVEGVPVLSSSRVSPSLIGVFELAIAIPADALPGNNTFLEVGVLVTKDGDFQFANPGVGSKIPIQ
jgi:uncharacterized protein (TIGR03437 family)